MHPDTPWITIDALDSSKKDDNGADDIEQTAGSTQIITCARKQPSRCML